MSYLVLARKWRPQTFADLVGQEHVAQTLRNAIAQGRIAHAFLFTGARGVGKTTIARVLAKALNCQSADGPTPEPCAKCAACTEIARGNDVDVHEIDGASNNSVDDVRRLQESLPYLPQRDRFKVVIVDEVHMLSSGAFNALLKTLEEPPPHVKFVFATTEVHKVPITILSRCQRYDFKLIATQKIRERIEYILGQEQIPFDAPAVALVAREAAGSMRDALSLLDQAIAGATHEGLRGTEVARLLGVADRAVLYELARSVLGGDAAAALRTVDSITREGFDLGHFARGFLNVLRDLVVARVVPESAELMDLADEERADVLAIAKGADGADLERLFAAWSRTADEVARAREPRWLLEMALVRLSHRPPLVPIDEIIARLADLERRLGAGGDTRGPSPGGAPGKGSAPSGGAPGASRGGSAGGAPGPASRTQASGGPSAVGVASGGPSTVSTPSAPRAGLTASVADVPTSGPSAVSATVNNASGAGASAVSTAAAATTAFPVNGALAQSVARLMGITTQPAANSEPVVQAAPSAQPAVSRSAAPAVEMLDVAGAAEQLDAWESVLAAMENGPIAVLEHAVPMVVSAERVKIAYEPGSFYARKVSAGTEVQDAIVAAAEKRFGVKPEVEIALGGLAEDAPTIARRREARKEAQRKAREAAAVEHPLVKSFLAHVGGEVRAVRLDEG